MARKIEVSIVGDSRDAERAFNRAAASAHNFGSRMATVGKVAAAGFAAVGVAAAVVAKKAVTAASDLNEQVNKAAVVFRKSGAEIVQWSQGLVSNFGLSSRAALEAAGTFGNMLVPMGFAREKAADMSKRMVELAGDMASFNNASPAETLEAIRAGLAGESEPLRRFGVFLSDARQKAQALSMHLYKGKGVLDANAKAAATYALILKDTKDAQGDFARTSTGLANAQRVARAAIENLAAQMGGLLLPVAARATSAFAEFVGRVAEAKGIRAKLNIVWETARGTAESIQAKLAAAVAAVNWAVVWGKAQGIADGLRQRFESIDWGATGRAIGDGIAKAVDDALQASSGIPTAFENSFRTIDWVKLGRAAGPGIAAALVSAFVAITDPGFWIKNWDLALAVALSVFGKGIGKIAGRLAAPLVRVMGDAVLAAAGAIERLSPRLAAAFLNLMLRLPGLAGRALRTLEDLVGRVFGRLGGIAKFAVKVLGIQAAIGGIVSFAQTVWGWIQKVVNWFKGLPGRIIRAIGHPDLSGIGRAMVQGLIDGMGSKVGDLVKKAGDLVNAAKRRFQFWKSPPEAYGRYIGEAVAGGIAAGIEGGIAPVIAAAGRLVSAAKKKMNAEAREIARMQAQIDATARAREDRDNARALADAQKQLAEARKKGKGAQDAERAVNDALDRIRDTARQRELDKAQRNYDKLQKTFDAAQAKLEKAQQKAADRLQKMQDRAGTAFDRLAAKIQTAFGAKNDAWVAPAQQAIDAIMDRRAQEDLQSAADDAQKAYEEAVLGGDKADIARKLRDRDRTLEDIQVRGLEGQAAIQETAHRQWVDAQQEALDAALEGLRTSLTEQGIAWDKGLSGALGIISTYVGPFSEIGKTLGSAFASSLSDAAMGVADAGAAVQAARGGRTWAAPTNGIGYSAAGSGVTKVYNLNIGKVEEARPDETALYFRRMERLGT